MLFQLNGAHFIYCELLNFVFLRPAAAVDAPSTCDSQISCFVRSNIVVDAWEVAAVISLLCVP